jgi:hypothetical protein
MKLVRWCALATLLLPSVCPGQLYWGFENDGVVPQGWAQDDADGLWSISTSIIDPNYESGKVLSASLYPPPEFSTNGQGSIDGDQAVEVDSPEFRFHDIRSAVLDFDLNINQAGCTPDSCLDAIQVLLVPAITGVEFTLLEYFRRDGGTPTLPVRIVDDTGFDPDGNAHVDNQTVYRIRMRVFDGDINPSVFEVDNLSMTSAFLTADYNQNGMVDAADYVVWRNLNQQSGAGLAADGNGDGNVDQGDYVLWRNSFGTSAAAALGTAASAASAAEQPVPEPRSVLLLALLVMGLTINPAALQWFVRHENPRQDRLVLDCRGR